MGGGRPDVSRNQVFGKPAAWSKILALQFEASKASFRCVVMSEEARSASYSFHFSRATSEKGSHNNTTSDRRHQGTTLPLLEPPMTVAADYVIAACIEQEAHHDTKL
jgi:hypothetical protein